MTLTVTLGPMYWLSFTCIPIRFGISISDCRCQLHVALRPTFNSCSFLLNLLFCFCCFAYTTSMQVYSCTCIYVYPIICLSAFELRAAAASKRAVVCQMQTTEHLGKWGKPKTWLFLCALFWASVRIALWVYTRVGVKLWSSTSMRTAQQTATSNWKRAALKWFIFCPTNTVGNAKENRAESIKLPQSKAVLQSASSISSLKRNN